jgi:hypothetical protein
MVELVSISPQEPPPEVTEKKEDDKVNMEFSTPIQDVMGAEFDEVMPEKAERPGVENYMRRPEINKESAPKPKEEVVTKKTNPMGLTDDQYQAVIAGVAAVVAFSEPVHGKVMQMLPQAFIDGKTTPMGYIVMIALAAVIYILIKRFSR